jgi:hypothetical protein
MSRLRLATGVLAATWTTLMALTFAAPSVPMAALAARFDPKHPHDWDGFAGMYVHAVCHSDMAQMRCTPEEVGLATVVAVLLCAAAAAIAGIGLSVHPRRKLAEGALALCALAGIGWGATRLFPLATSLDGKIVLGGLAITVFVGVHVLWLKRRGIQAVWIVALIGLVTVQLAVVGGSAMASLSPSIRAVDGILGPLLLAVLQSTLMLLGPCFGFLGFAKS